MAKKIYYETNGTECLAECPHNMKSTYLGVTLPVMVGSYRCAYECNRTAVDSDKKGKYVMCAFKEETE